jgi:hypothetical protein
MEICLESFCWFCVFCHLDAPQIGVGRGIEPHSPSGLEILSAAPCHTQLCSITYALDSPSATGNVTRMTKNTSEDAQATLDRLRAMNRARVAACRARKRAKEANKAQKAARSVALRARKERIASEKRKKLLRAKKRAEQKAFRIQANIDRKEKLDAFIASKN